jgi:hypothetical protein
MRWALAAHPLPHNNNQPDALSNLLEQTLRLPQVSCVEPLGEPAVNWGETLACLGVPALAPKKPR